MSLTTFPLLLALLQLQQPYFCFLDITLTLPCHGLCVFCSCSLECFLLRYLHYSLYDYTYVCSFTASPKRPYLTTQYETYHSPFIGLCFFLFSVLRYLLPVLVYSIYFFYCMSHHNQIIGCVIVGMVFCLPLYPWCLV